MLPNAKNGKVIPLMFLYISMLPTIEYVNDMKKILFDTFSLLSIIFSFYMLNLLYSKISPGWQLSASHIFISVEIFIAFAFPVFSIDIF